MTDRPPGAEDRDDRLLRWWRSPGVSLVLGAVSDGVALLAHDSRLLAANDQAARMFGLEPTMMADQPLTDPSWQVVGVDGQPLTTDERPVVRCLRTGQPQRVERLGLTINDTMVWLRMAVDPVRLDGRGLDGLLLCFGVVGPPSDRGGPDVQRPADPPMTGVLLSLSPGGAIIDVLDGDTQALLGRDPADLPGQLFHELLHPLDGERLINDPSLLHRRAGVHRMTLADGRIRWLETEADLVNDEDGAIRRVDLHVTDVTERHVIQQSLRQAEERFRLAFDLAPTGNAIVLPDGRFMRVNTALARMLHLPAAELLGRRWASLVVPEDAADLTGFLEDVLTGQDELRTTDVRMLDSRGRRVQCTLTASAVHDEQNRPAYVIAHVENVTTRRLTQAALSHQATHDALTTLPNRTILLERLGRAIVTAAASGAGDAVIAALYCDLDRFKRINDSLGHDVGDLILVEVARRLRTTIGEEDTAGRLGGDEFLVVATRADVPAVLQLAEALKTATDVPMTIEDRVLQVSMSVGVAIATPGETPAELLRRSDTALYEAKERGRNRVEVFDESLRERARRRLQTETDLHAALAAAQMRLFHQPIVALRDGAMVGREALVRWFHPRLGVLEPGDFLAVAEESDLIRDLGRWVLTEAVSHASQPGPDGSTPYVSVNVSPRELVAGTTAGRVMAALEAAGLPGHRLVLEITESVLLEASPATVADLTELTRSGVRLAVDDFGTGFASLTYLQKLPVSIVKIDRSFVSGVTTDPSRRAIVQAVINLGEALGLDVVAEGVERAEQSAALTALGCGFAQGHLFGRPSLLP